MIDALLQEKITTRLIDTAPTIPVGVSNRHVHLSQQDVEALFGVGYQLTPFKPLRQPGQFAAEECVTVVGPKGSLTHVRVLGPVRPTSQLEISRADCFTLGIKAPVRESGNWKMPVTHCWWGRKVMLSCIHKSFAPGGIFICLPGCSSVECQQWAEGECSQSW